MHNFVKLFIYVFRINKVVVMKWAFARQSKNVHDGSRGKKKTCNTCT